jgi:quercetin dioxygenase-like cupin family protein
MRTLLLLSLIGCTSTPAPAAPVATNVPDPTVTDPDNYKAILDNEHVRVLRYHDEPGTKTHLHHHPASVLYALSTFRRRLTFGDGKTQERELHEGDVVWLPAQDHMGENIGTTATEVLLVEIKAPSTGR